MRLSVVLLVLVALGVPPAAAARTSQVPHRRAEVRSALEVLHGWDDRRARAWARSDAAALRALYVPGSLAARADVRLLRSYTARGLVVRRLVTQVFGVRVLRQTPRRVTVRVLDRVAGGRVDDGSRALPLPSSRPALRRIDFRRTGDTWQVVTVTR